MLSNLGFYSLVFGLITSFVIIFKATTLIKNNENNFIININYLLFFQLFFVLLSFVFLLCSFILSDFSNITVYNYSHTTKPLFYKISGLWGNHEGSLLLWLLVLTSIIFIFVCDTKNFDSKYKLYTILFHEIIVIGFFLFILFTSNPFEIIFPIPNEGLGLNPILQDPALAIHPPVLYLGYVGTSIIFSASLSAIINKNVTQPWAKHIKKWTFISWIFLTLGIMLGSIWAYYELGWGGFWFWDPVENASLLPWLTGTALLHSIIVAEKNKKLITWSIVLSIVTFCLSLLGTFLVRSGVLTSVHAFANDPQRGLFILILLVVIVGLGLFLYWKYSGKLTENKSIKLVSREGAISLNNIFMLTIAGTVLLGTIYPLFTEAFLNKKISVGAPFFNKTIVPFVLPMVLGMVVGPFLKWGRDDLLRIFSRLRTLFITMILISTVFCVIADSAPFVANLFILLGFCLAVASIFQLLEVCYINYKNGKKQIFRIPLKNVSQGIAHLGLGLFIIGATGTSILKKENIQFQHSGEAVNINDYKIVFEGVEDRTGPNFISSYATFTIFKNNELKFVLNPEKRQYNMNKQVTTEAAIYSTFLGDVYIAIGEQVIKDGKEYWTTRIWFNSYTIWIWIGIILMFFGGVISILKFLKT